MKKTNLFYALTLASSIFLSNAHAYTPHVIYDKQGNSVFELRLYNKGDTLVFNIFGSYNMTRTSTWDINSLTAENIKSASQYWADIIKVVPGKNPAIIALLTDNKANAGATSWVFNKKYGAGSTIYAALNNGEIDLEEMSRYGNIHGFITIGDKLDWDWEQPFVPSQLIQTSKVDMTSTLIHELVHGLGMSASITDLTVDGKVRAYFDSNINAWTSHLIDQNGKAPKAYQVITCDFCETTIPRADTFNTGEDGIAYFSGKNVSEVLNNKDMPGIPVRIDSKLRPKILDASFSHSELRNGLMSHQNYRNYMTLMEAEFAILQDIGFSIDRRNLFGYSVYNDGITFINDHPFFARNSEGTAYIPNTYNTATMGLGLHVYGSNNTIIQRADLLSGGAGGAGIRVDGIGNNLTILPGTKVHANGVNGMGVLFAYGKNHHLTLQGDVQAMGENGIAVNFDFGHNSLGDNTEYRGSYFVTSGERNLQEDYRDYYNEAIAEVDGPLVSRFDLTGSIAGRKAAINMSESGYVQEINIMQGASITGDILSNYKRFDDDNNLRLTDLNFGVKPNDHASSVRIADSNFKLTYGNNILGDNIRLNFVGGTSVLTGHHNVNQVNIHKGSVLASRGEYTVANDRSFNNHGTLYAFQSGNPITIHGNYNQSQDGRLQLSFNNMKQISSLVVNNIANINGTIAFTPERGYYHNGFTITSDQWLQAYVMTGNFTEVSTALSSPTLTANAIDNGGLSYTIKMTRHDDPYSQYANNSENREVGLALDNISKITPSESYSLLAALDFSEADGSTIRSALPLLSGEAYASAKGVLVNSSGIIRSSANNRLLQSFGSQLGNTITRRKDNTSLNEAWGTAYGSWVDQSSHQNSAGTKSSIRGLITGIDGNIHDDWRLGVMIGYGHNTFKTSELSSSGSSDNYTIGTYAGTEWLTEQGSIGFRSGLSYTWHQMEMKRSIAFNGYSDKLSADYNAGTFQVFGELGYQHKFSQNLHMEPYANLSYVNVKTNAFTEKGSNGAALRVHSGTMDTALSTLGMRVFSNFDFDNTLVTARADLGWRHAFGKIIPKSTANFAVGSSTFTSSGTPIGKNTALIEAGLDFSFSKNTKLGIAYQGQFGSGIKENGVNVNFTVKF